MSLAAMNVAAGYADNVIALTSSHFASAENSSDILWNMAPRDLFALHGR